jgi:hypothetical protein
MANGFAKFLSTVGKDFEKALKVVLPIAQAAEPFMAVAVPGIGSVYAAVVNAVVYVESKWSALGQQSGSGTQKAADALQLLLPVLPSMFTAVGVSQMTQEQIAAYIKSVVDGLNTIQVPVPAKA